MKEYSFNRSNQKSAGFMENAHVDTRTWTHFSTICVRCNCNFSTALLGSTALGLQGNRAKSEANYKGINISVGQLPPMTNLLALPNRTYQEIFTKKNRTYQEGILMERNICCSRRKVFGQLVFLWKRLEMEVSLINERCVYCNIGNCTTSFHRMCSLGESATYWVYFCEKKLHSLLIKINLY
jgi:hypothetical protein